MQQKKKLENFFLLLPENKEKKGHAIQHQCSCPMTPHHPIANWVRGCKVEQHCIDVTCVSCEVKGNSSGLDAGQTPSVNIFRILKTI